MKSIKKVVDHTCYGSIYFPNLTLSSKRLEAELLHLVVRGRTVPLFEADTQTRNLPFTSVEMSRLVTNSILFC